MQDVLSSLLARLRAAGWAVRALRALRRELPQTGLRSRPPSPPPLPADALAGVAIGVRAGRASCLERSLILQRWLASHGRRHDVLVGVSTAAGFEAHAWLEGLEDGSGGGYVVLERIAAPQP